MRKFAAVLAAVPLLLLAAPAVTASASGTGGKQIFCPAGTHADRDGDRCLPGSLWHPRHHHRHHHGR